MPGIYDTLDVHHPELFSVRSMRFDASGLPLVPFRDPNKVVIYAPVPHSQGVVMGHKQANLLRTIFQDTHVANIHWREVESLLNHLGAEVEPSHGARFKVTLNGVTDFLHHPHHGTECTRDHIKHLREFLVHAGVSLSAYEAEKDK